MIIEVFVTDVQTRQQADLLVKDIHSRYPGYRVNFDLDDCDRILRVCSKSESVDATGLITLLDMHGYRARILDESLEEN